MFTPNNDDLNFLFESAGQKVLINDVEQQVIITNPPLSENEERFIHSLGRLNMGDLLDLDGNKYLIMTESVTARNGKYKAKMRHCNFVIQLPGDIEEVLLTDENGNPIYDELTGEPIFIEVEGDPYFIPAIVENKTFSISGSQILVSENQIIVITQDNQTNREKFAINAEFELMNKNWQVTNQNLTKKGLILSTCQVVV